MRAKTSGSSMAGRFAALVLAIMATVALVVSVTPATSFADEVAASDDGAGTLSTLATVTDQTGGDVAEGEDEGAPAVVETDMVPDLATEMDQPAMLAMAESAFTVDADGTITAYNGTDLAVEIPPSIDGVTVTAIGYQAFYGKSITSVKIPAGVKSIGISAFNSCSSLNSVTFAEGSLLTSIGTTAFYDCASLEEVTIPSGVTSIGNSAFHYCNQLKRVYISDLAAWCAIGFGDDASNPLRRGTDNTLYLNGEAVSGQLTIPDGMTTIGNRAFYGYGRITSVTIPSSVTSIGYKAFSHCNNLASVTIPSSVETIGDSAFENCDSLASVVIPGRVTGFGRFAFQNCDSLASVTIEDGVTGIGDYAFYMCDNLESVVIPGSVTDIGKRALATCGSLHDIWYIGSWAGWDGVAKGSLWNDAAPYDQTIHFLFTVSAAVSPAGSGTVSVSPDPDGAVAGTYNSNTAVTVTASSVSGYAFVNWTENGSVVGTGASCTVNDGDNHKLTANFSNHFHGDIAFAPWDKTDALPTSGSYYLTQAVNVSGMTTVSQGSTLNLCLNGQTVTYTGGSDCIFQVNGELNLYDESGKNGTITGGKNGGVHVAGGTFTMYGGSITGNTAQNGGGVYVENGAFNMYGGSITGNTATDFGGGVTVTWTSKFKISGNPIISNNTKGGSPNNVYLIDNGNDRSIIDVSTLTNTAPIIGVTLKTPGVFTRGASFADDAAAQAVFTSDDNSYIVTRTSDGQAQLTQTYTVNVSVNPTGGGTVTGGGRYADGSAVTLKATANSGYTFVNWTEKDANGVVRHISNDAEYAFTLEADRTLTANFSQGTGDLKINNPGQYDRTVIVTLDNTTINGTYGDASTGMTFKDGVCTLTLSAGASAIAVGLPAGIDFKISKTDAEGGSEIDSGTIPVNSVAGSLWIEKQVTVDGAATTTNEADGTYNFVISGTKGQDPAKVLITIENGETKIVSNGNLIPDTYTVTEDTKDLPAGVSVSSANPQTVTIDGIDLYNPVVFINDYVSEYSVACVANPTEGGMVTAEPATATKDTPVTLSGAPNPGYALTGLTINKDPNPVPFKPNNGSFSGTFDMPGEDVTATATFNKIVIADIPAQDYTGAAIEPEITVSLDGVDLQLVKGEDYTVAYDNNVSAGEATVTVTLSSAKVVGTQTATFTIKQAPLTIAMADRELPYNGQTQYGWSRTDEGKETVTGLLNNETLTIDYTHASGETVGTYENGAYDSSTLVIMDGSSNVTGNYSLTAATAGKLTITPADATLKVTKAIAGAAWPPGATATFTVSANDGGPLPDPASVTLQAAGEVEFAPIDYELTDVGRSYSYTIAETSTAGFGGGWTHVPTSVTATVAVTTSGTTVSYSPADATFTNTFISTYLVTFVDEDGTVLKDATAYRMGTAAADIEQPATPTKAPTDRYSYTFAGWSPEIADVTADATYTATYTQTVNKATLTFVLNGGTLDGKTGTITVKANVGDTVTLLGAPTRDGYTFRCWKGSEYAAGAKYTVPAGGHTFTAEWTRSTKPGLPATGDDMGPATAARVFAVLGSLFVLVGFAQKHKSRRGCHSRS